MILINVLRAFFVILAIGAESWIPANQEDPWLSLPAARNAIQGLCILAAVLLSFTTRGKITDLPSPRKNATAYWILGIVAFAVSITTITIPFISDDFVTLERAKGAATPLQWVNPGEPTIGNFFRPAVWWHWWMIQHFFGGSLVAARLISVLWFCINTILIMPALRRAGIPRGIAFASAILFATNPVGVTVIAWLSNYYSQVSLGFILASIASLPARRPTLKNCVPVFIFSLLAGLSKEDAILLPFLIFGIAARFRFFNFKQFRRAFLLALPAAAGIAVMVGLRFAALGGIGGYGVGAHEPFQINKWLNGWKHAFANDLPTRYWMPFRVPEFIETFSFKTVLAMECAAAIIITTYLALGLGRPNVRRSLLLSISICFFGFIPVAGLLELKPDLETIRLLYPPAVGMALLVASIAAGFSLSARARWGIIVFICIVGAVIGQFNLLACRHGGELHEKALAQFVEFTKPLPPKGRVFLERTTRAYKGTMYFGGGFPWSFRYRANRYDLDLQQMPPTSPGFFDIYKTFDNDRGVFVDPMEYRESIPLKMNETLTFDFVKNRAERDHFDVLECTSFDWRNGEWALWANQGESCIIMKPLSVPSPCKIDVFTDAAYVEDTTMPVMTLLYKDGNRYELVASGTTGEKIIPAGASHVRLALHPGLNSGHLLKLTKLTIRISPAK